MKFKLPTPPPDNSSKETRLIKLVENYNDGKVDEDVVKRGQYQRCLS